uniref:Uncharacterized protein n=1 Tax=Magallana gigas TaxID=29159 RepID=K1QAN4_MAGGI
MGTPNWATYFDGVEPDYPGRVREERDYGYCPKQTQDTRRRKQGVVLPEDAFTLQDLEIIPSATGGHFTSGSINRTSGSLPRSPLQSPNYSSSSVFSDFQCSSPVSVNQGRALPPIPVEGTGSKNSGSVRSCNGRFPSRNPLEMKLSPTYSNRELPNIPTDQRQKSSVYVIDLKRATTLMQIKNVRMIQAITHMRVLNKPFVIQMSNSSSVEFLQFSSVFEDDINEVFLRSNISTYFYGTNVDALRNGSIYTHSDIFFQDVEPLRDPSVFVSTLRDSSSPITYKSIKAVRFGDNIVDYNSIHVDLSFITVDKYPEKPTLKGETEVMHAIEESTKPKSPSSNIPETNEKAKAPVFIPDFRRKKPPIRMQLPTTAPSVVEEGEPEVIKQEPEIEPKQNKIRPEKETTMTPVVTQTISTPNPTTFSSTIHSAGIGKFNNFNRHNIESDNNSTDNSNDQINNNNNRKGIYCNKDNS